MAANAVIANLELVLLLDIYACGFTGAELVIPQSLWKTTRIKVTVINTCTA